MGINVLKGRNVRIEVSTALMAADAVTAVSQASPGVATSAGHGLANGTIGFFDNVGGMSELDGMAVAVANTTADTFALQRCDTTTFGAYTGGNFIGVQTWATLAEATSLQVGGGDASKIDITTLLDNIRQEENGLLAAQSISVGAFVTAVTSAAMDAVEAAARNNGYLVFRATWPNGYRVIFRAQPSLPGMDTNVDQAVTGGFSASVKGWVTKLPTV
jgi:hypothetical protein